MKNTSSLRKIPFRKLSFSTEDHLWNSLLVVAVLPVVVCWQDCSSCLCFYLFLLASITLPLRGTETSLCWGIVMSVCSVSLCLFVFLVASVSLPPPSTSLHHDLADWHLPSSHHPPHQTSSLRNQTLPFRKPGFAREDLRLASLSELVLLLLLLLFCLLLSVGKIALLACWGSVVSVCCLSLCLVVCFLGGFC